MTKLGIIRCNTHSEGCAGYKCFPSMREQKVACSPPTRER